MSAQAEGVQSEIAYRGQAGSANAGRPPGQTGQTGMRRPPVLAPNGCQLLPPAGGNSGLGVPEVPIFQEKSCFFFNF